LGCRKWLCEEIINRGLGTAGKVVVRFSEDINKTHHNCAMVDILQTSTWPCEIFAVASVIIYVFVSMGLQKLLGRLQEVNMGKKLIIKTNLGGGV
jgi:hypothetical protein